MSSPLPTERGLRHAPAPADPVGVLLQDLRLRWRASVIFEHASGEVLAHAVHGEAPASVSTAIVARSSARLHACRGPARVGRLLPGGPALVTTLLDADHVVTVLPVAEHGWLWVLHAPDSVWDDAAWEDVVGVAGALVDVLDHVTEGCTDPTLLALLNGDGSIGPARLPTASTWVGAVVTAEARVCANALHQALRASSPNGGALAVAATTGSAHLVLEGPPTEALAQAALHDVLRGAELTLGLRLCGAFVRADRGWQQARVDADLALATRRLPGAFLSADLCRPYVLLPVLLKAVEAAPAIGSDPVSGLRHVQPELVETVTAWLDHMGNVPDAAAALGEHGNTFRYRLRRAQALIRADLTDPVARLEVHLRLLALREEMRGS